MDDQYTIHVTVVAPDGNSVFDLTAHAKESDLYLPGHVAPGTEPVLAYLVKVTEGV